MKFCNECDNMLSLKITPNSDPSFPDKLHYVCRSCNFETEHKPEEDSCIFKLDYNIDNIKKNSFINPFIYEDQTLPRAEGIKCPNAKCPKAKPEIVYIKYDNDNMKFIYICLDCYKANITPHIW